MTDTGITGHDAYVVRLFTPDSVLHNTSHVYAHTSDGFFEKKEYYTFLSNRKGGRLHLYLAANVAHFLSKRGH